MTVVRTVRRIRLTPRDGVIAADDLPTSGATVPALIVDIGAARDFALGVPQRIAHLAFGSDHLQLEGERAQVVTELAACVQRILADLAVVA